MKNILIGLLILTYTSACIQHNSSNNQYKRSDKFTKTIRALNDSLGKKYSIKEYLFDTEDMYKKEELTQLIKELLEFGDFNFTFIKDGLDRSKRELYTIYEVSKKQYKFRMSSEGDNLGFDEKAMRTLDSVVLNNKPDYQYNYSNATNATIFLKTADLENAVNEGYPCPLANGHWDIGTRWKWGVYSDIIVHEIPNFDDLKIKYIQTIEDLYARGFNVPNLSINRVYIDDVYNDNRVDIVIDGSIMPNSSSQIVENQIRCNWDSWGILLAYTLVKHYDGQATLFDKKEIKGIPLSPQQYLETAELAFGRR